MSTARQPVYDTTVMETWSLVPLHCPLWAWTAYLLPTFLGFIGIGSQIIVPFSVYTASVVISWQALDITYELPSWNSSGAWLSCADQKGLERGSGSHHCGLSWIHTIGGPKGQPEHEEMQPAGLGNQGSRRSNDTNASEVFWSPRSLTDSDGILRLPKLGEVGRKDGCSDFCFCEVGAPKLGVTLKWKGAPKNACVPRGEEVKVFLPKWSLQRSCSVLETSLHLNMLLQAGIFLTQFHQGHEQERGS
jgi:hypothetical protein